MSDANKQVEMEMEVEVVGVGWRLLQRKQNGAMWGPGIIDSRPLLSQLPVALTKIHLDMYSSASHLFTTNNYSNAEIPPFVYTLSPHSSAPSTPRSADAPTAARLQRRREARAGAQLRPNLHEHERHGREHESNKAEQRRRPLCPEFLVHLVGEERETGAKGRAHDSTRREGAGRGPEVAVDDMVDWCQLCFWCSTNRGRGTCPARRRR